MTDNQKKFLKDLVYTFLDHYDNNALYNVDMLELYRYSLCKALDLQTKYSSSEVQVNSDKVEKKFKKILNKYGILKHTTEKEKQGILEMSIHTFLATVKKAGV